MAHAVLVRPLCQHQLKHQLRNPGTRLRCGVSPLKIRVLHSTVPIISTVFFVLSLLLFACVAAVISLRTVPDQDSAVLEQIIHDHLVSAMAARGTRNTLRMRVKARGKWWLQDPFSDSYQAAARAIEKHWGVKPNFVCEGGTLRVTPFLEEVCAVWSFVRVIILAICTLSIL